MELDDILSAFDTPASRCPKEALWAAQEEGERITDLLIERVERARQRSLEGLPVVGDGHLFAMFLLARLEQERAFPVVADLLTLSTEVLDGLLGDTITEDLGRILASLSGGRMDRLISLFEDSTRSPYVRVAAMVAIEALVARGVMERSQAAAYFRSLVQNGGFDDVTEEVSTELGSAVLDLYIDDLFGELRHAIRRGSIASFAIALEDIADTERVAKNANRGEDPYKHWASWSESDFFTTSGASAPGTQQELSKVSTILSIV